jgi:hypothetical protein
MSSPAAKKSLFALLAVLGTLFAVALPAAALANPATISVYDSLANLRPDRPAPAGASQQASIGAAQNEAESFQILVQAGSAGNPGLSVDPGAPLSGPGGATLPASAMTIYRETYYQATTRSDAEGGVGAWPDALIPERDDLYGEDRTAFPFDVAGGKQVAVWVDVLVPVGQAAGDYSGSVVVKDSTGTVATVPVTLMVQDFSLPSTSSLKNAYFISWDKICTAFTGSAGCSSAEQAWQYETLFAEAGLNNRVTLANAYAASPSSPYFAQYFAPLVQGNDPRVRLPGAKLTTVEVYGPSCGNCLGPWKAAAEQYGFADRFFLYACDEPSSSADWEQCKRNTEAGEQGWPGVRSLVTAGMNGDASSYVDTFSPLINDVDPASGSKRASYDSFLKGSNKELWMYTSCRSYSCDSSEGSTYDGWPGYAIDQPASQARAMGWLSYLYKASGELYYATAQSLTTAATDQYESGGNGDGNLFYAGTPGGGNGSLAIGGAHPIPIETIRLKRIRDGREDYEYLHLLAQRGQTSTATSIVRGLFGSEQSAGHNTTISSGSLAGARAQLASAITGQPVPAPTPEPTPTPTPESGPAYEPAPTPAPAPASKPSPSSTAPAVSTSAVVPAPSAAAPRLRVLRVKVPRSARQLRHRGVHALVVCSADCQVDLGSEVSPTIARKLGLGTTRLGTGTVHLRAGRPGWVVARLTGSANAKILQAGTDRFPSHTDVNARPA